MAITKKLLSTSVLYWRGTFLVITGFLTLNQHKWENKGCFRILSSQKRALASGEEADAPTSGLAGNEGSLLLFFLALASFSPQTIPVGGHP